MSRLGHQDGRSGRPLAGVEERAGQIHIVIARRGDSLSILEARSFSLTDHAPLAALFDQYQVARVLRVAPLNQCLCRVARLPASTDEQSLATLTLLAEAELPDSIPAHRRAGGLIPDVVRGPERTALLTGWIPDAAPAPLGEDLDESWVAAPAALAMLKHDAALAAWSDASTGAISILASGPAKTLCRSLREPTNAWDETLARALHETANAADVQRVPATTLGMLLSEASVKRLTDDVSGVRTDPAWLAKYALALGAILLADDARESTRALASMTFDPRTPPRTPLVRFIESLAQAKAAIWALVLALALVLLLPIGGAYARLALLDARTESLKGTQDKTDDLTKTARLFDELDKQRLPMSKLLADVAGCAPVGVSLENVRLTKEQGLTLLGTAESREKLNQFQANLNKTRVFVRATINRSETTAAGVSFDISSQIEQPHLAVKPAEDLGGKSLAEVLYGEGASNEEFTSTGSNGDRRGSGRRPSFTPGATSSGDASRRPVSAPATPPPALTDAAIAAMDRATLIKEFADRRKYVQSNPGTDAATRQRLEDEVQKLRQKMASGGGS